MRIVSLSAIFAVSLFAQAPADLFQKAPPAVDQALRERIARFYQLHVDSKFRQAESLVAEDSNDFFYSTNKPMSLAFEIKNIPYSDTSAMAKAAVRTTMVVMAQGFLGKPVPVPI